MQNVLQSRPCSCELRRNSIRLLEVTADALHVAGELEGQRFEGCVDEMLHCIRPCGFFFYDLKGGGK